MFVAWISTVSIGVIVARFFKPVWSHSFLFGKELWFQVGKISPVSLAVCSASLVGKIKTY